MMYFYLLVGVVFEILGDYYLKLWTVSNTVKSIIAGVGLYALATLFFAFALKNDSLTKLICLFTIVNCIAACIIGSYFDEPITLKMKFGILLGMVSIYLLH